LIFPMTTEKCPITNEKDSGFSLS
jgi:hypothetical protein